MWLPLQATPLVIKLRALYIILFRTNHNWDHFRIGHACDYQQQHILIIVCISWDLEVDLHEPKVWDGCIPCPL